MLAVQRGDAEAFEVLFRKYAGALVRFASGMLGSRARGEEVAQETFAHVFRSRYRYRPRARFTTWLYRIATNLCVSDLRRAERRRAVQGDEAVRDPADVADPRLETAETVAGRRERLAVVREALLTLPPRQRAALWLVRVEGCSYEEVAGRIGCTVGAVKSLVHRATLALQAAIEGAESEGGG